MWAESGEAARMNEGNAFRSKVPAFYIRKECLFHLHHQDISGLVSLKILARPLTEIQIFKYQPPLLPHTDDRDTADLQREPKRKIFCGEIQILGQI